MFDRPELFVWAGSVGLGTWMIAGIIAIVSYARSFKAWANLLANASTGMFAAGAVLEMIMLIVIFTHK